MIKWINGRGRIAAPVARYGGAILVLCLACGACRTAPPLAGDSVQRLLILVSEHDPAGSFRGLEATLAQNFARYPALAPRYLRVDEGSEFREAILSDAARRGPLHGLVLAFHGKPNKLYLSATEVLHQRNVDRWCQGLHRALHPEARVLLYSCLTGEGEDNLAADLAQALRRPVMAPVYHWLMQTALPLSQRVPELTLDTRRRLAIDAPRFELFYKRRYKSHQDRYLIAPREMTPLCAADGFVCRPSRFRPLFQLFHP